jgi:hypothetical protein
MLKFGHSEKATKFEKIFHFQGMWGHTQKNEEAKTA